MLRTYRLTLILGAFCVAGCSNDRTPMSPPPVVPSSVSIVGGNGQTGNVRSTLPAPLTVAVVNTDGTAAANVAVAWTKTGDGTLTASSSLTDAQGRASVSWTLGNAAGNQTATATITGLAGSPANFTVTTTAPIVLQFNGTSWSTMLQDTSAAIADLRSIWGASASDILVVGRCRSNTLMIRYNGTAWSVPPSNCFGAGSLASLTSVWGNSGTDIFVVGRSPLPPSFTDWIIRSSGQGWTEVYRNTCSFCSGLRAVWSRAANDVIAVGDSGKVRHFDGTNWNSEATAVTANLTAVWGTGTTGGVFAVGDAGTILSNDGSSWHQQPSGTTQPLFAVWGTSPTDVFAVGGAGTILHYNGTAWTAQNSGSTQTLVGMWGSSGSSVFVVGNHDTILHYDGTSWTPQAANAAIDLRSVWGSSPSNVFAVGWPR